MGLTGRQEGFAMSRTRRTVGLCSAAGSAPTLRRADCGSVLAVGLFSKEGAGEFTRLNGLGTQKYAASLTALQ